MLSTRTQNEFGTWESPGSKPVIVYGMALMAKLAAEASRTSPTPIGGVLFGTASDQDTRITAFRPIECVAGDDGASPFSEAGELAIGRLAESWADDPELAELKPVGWYRSRWESAIQMNQEDLSVWNRFFPEPWQITLVLRVQDNLPVRAGFFFRPQNNGPVRIDSSYRTFEIDPGPEATTDVGRLAEAVKSGGQVTSVLEDSPSPPPELFTPPEPPSNRAVYLWAAVGSAVVALVVVAIPSWPPSLSTAPLPGQEVALRFKGPPHRLLLAWNPQASWIRDAQRAELHVVDGESDTTEQIAAAELAGGARPVMNRSGLVEAQLRIHFREAGREPGVAVAEFVGPAAGDTPAGAVDASPLLAEQESLQKLLDWRVKSNRFVEDRVAKLRELIARRPPVKNRGPGATSLPPITAVDTSVKPEPSAPVSQPPAVVVEQAPTFGPDRAPARAASPSPEPPAYSGPTSGKFLWTGYLAPGKTVTIDGRRASSGSVNGSLPGVPVRVSVYPGEFSTAGLSVFSASPRHQNGSVIEGRNAQNGWLNTRYVYDPARSRDAMVSAAPSDAGGFKQLQIAGGERPVSVVVVEWSVAK